MTNKEDAERYLKLSKKIEECYEEIKTLENNKEDEDNIKIKIKEINSKEEDIKDTILKIIGQMYEGVLIQDELTIRKGEFYKFKCRYELGFESIIRNIEIYQEHIRYKIGEKNLELVKFIIEEWKKLEDYQQEIRNKEIIEKLEIEPITISKIKSYMRKEIGLDIIKKIIIDKKGMCLNNMNDNEIRNYNDISIKSIRFKFKDEIEKMEKVVLENHIKLEFQLDKFIKELKEKGGKYLIASKL